MSPQDHVVDVEENLPHNGKPISKVAISPRSEYVLTYSQADESIVGWFVKDNSESIDIDEKFNAPMKTSSLPKYIFGLSQIENICDFKVSDNKVILYDLIGL